MATTTLSGVSPAPRESNSSQWLVSPAFDLLFLLNCLWPLVFLFGFQSDLAGHSAIQFWQLYFVTTPHRWLTLVLVAGDPSRFHERPRLFLSVAFAIVAGCLLVRVSTGALTCLLALDYIWNAWHFASQHHGIYRIYARQADRNLSPARVQKWSLRFTLLYVIARVAGWSWQFDSLEQKLFIADYFVIALLGMLVLWDWTHAPRSWGRSGYLTSVVLMYSALLCVVHLRRPDMVLVLATTSALFHAGEYLAIVSWNIRERDGKQQSRGLIRRVAPVWFLFLAVFALFLGIVGWYADQYWLKFWIVLNLIVAFLHYSYDALIWRKSPTR
jgi:hypothetical protein